MWICKKKIWLENSEKVYKVFSFFMILLSGLFFLISFKSKSFSTTTVELSNGLKYVCLISAIVAFIAGLLTCKTKIKSD